MRGYIIIYILVQLFFSCQDNGKSDNSIPDFNFLVHASFDSSYVDLETKFRNNTNQSLYIPKSNWIFEAKSYSDFIFYDVPGKSYVYNSIFFFPEKDSLSKNLYRTTKIDFQSINGFILIKPKESKTINISFNNMRSIHGKSSSFLNRDYKYSLLMDITVLDESDLNYISNIVNKNENQILIDSTSEINYSFGGRNSKTIYSSESIGLSKYNYEEKLELSELFQQNKYIFSLSQVSYKGQESLNDTTEISWFEKEEK